jgi:outer membrane protein OmpA-like peptidoglycan-associated protein
VLVDAYRTWLAVISLVCGLILFFLAGRSRFRKKSTRAPLALGFYGLLFLVTAFLLWQGRSSPSGRTTDRAEKPTKPPIETQDTLPAAGQPNIHRGDSTKHMLPVSVEAPAELSPTAVATRARSERTLAIPHRKRDNLQPSLDHDGGRLSFEDRAYLLLSHTFDAVEQWFMRHGSPAPAKRNDAENAGMELPRVSFRFGTAELQTKSREDLFRYAKYLRLHADPSLIEIQACSNEGGMEPFNYILTQARAEAVRDVLVENGVSTQRLVPVARGSQGTDSLGLSSHVRFVTRP